MSDPRWPDEGPFWPERDLHAGEHGPWPDEPDAGLETDPHAAPGVSADDYAVDEPAEVDNTPPPDDFPADDFELPAVLTNRYGSHGAPSKEPPVEAHVDPPVEKPAGPPPAEAEPPVEAEPPPAEDPADREVPWVAAEASTTAFGGDGPWDPKRDGERRRATTAEQAVPWMIGVILALSGMVIVLLALIFTAPDGLVSANSGSPTPSASVAPSVAVVPPGSPGASETPAASATPRPSDPPEATATPSPTPLPEYGPLEMVYLGRPSTLAPIYLLRKDFSTAAQPSVMAQAAQGVARYAWSPDGRFGAALIGARAVALTPGQSARRLADGISAITFGWDSSRVYAVRITQSGANDVANIVEIDFESARSGRLASVTYPRPAPPSNAALTEAQFIDDGGPVRIYATADGNLVLWVHGAPSAYRIDPGDGSVTNILRQPVLWSPDGRRRITLAENANGTTVIAMRDRSGDAQSSVSVTGLVSHLRWVRSSNEIVFTLGVISSAGGVRQDLYVWDLVDGKAPMPLTSNGASFGAEWVGSAAHWQP